MEEKNRLKLVACVDLVVSIFILITGVFVIYFGICWGDYVNLMTGYSSYSSYTSSQFSWVTVTPWIIFFIGLTTIIYSIKRFIDNISKLFVH